MAKFQWEASGRGGETKRGVMEAADEAAVVNRLRGRRRTELEMAVGELRPVPVLNGLMRALLAPEAPLVGARWRLPVGTSLLAVASNPNSAAAAVAA